MTCENLRQTKEASEKNMNRKASSKAKLREHLIQYKLHATTVAHRCLRRLYSAITIKN